MMSQPNSSSKYTWSEQQQRYYEYTWSGTQWKPEWKAVGWRPPQQQPSPSIPSQFYDDSAYSSSPAFVSSPYTVSGQAGSPNTTTHATAASAQYNGYAGLPLIPRTSSSGSRPRTSSDGSLDQDRRFPKGVGVEILGHYNAKLGNTPGNLHYEEVDPSYFVRDRKFFEEGRVFAVIFTETAGSLVKSATSYNSCLSEARFSGNFVYTQSRRFVVVRHKREFCFACPIFTYSRRATLKRGVRPAEHGIAYSEGQQPTLLPGETGIKKPSLAVAMAQGEPSLDTASRIYYGIHHPIQYNVKVKDIGQVLPNYVPTLIGNWKAEDDGETKQSAEVTAAAEEPELPHVPEEEGYREGEQDVAERLISKPVKGPTNIPVSPACHKDPHLYHLQDNIYGYDAKINPHMYHPVHNPYGYHPKNNTHGYHPQSNSCSYHPAHNPYGYHPQKAPFCYHPQFSPFGYNGGLNVHGYHPDVTPFNYHPLSNPSGYHPQHNPHGYHPDHNPDGYHPHHHPYGYHPTLMPDNYHPKWRPQGQYYGPASSKPVSRDDEDVGTVGGEEDGEDAAEDQEEDDQEEDEEEDAKEKEDKKVSPQKQKAIAGTDKDSDGSEQNTAGEEESSSEGEDGSNNEENATEPASEEEGDSEEEDPPIVL